MPLTIDGNAATKLWQSRSVVPVAMSVLSISSFTLSSFNASNDAGFKSGFRFSKDSLYATSNALAAVVLLCDEREWENGIDKAYF